MSTTQAPKFKRGQRVRGIFSKVEREIWEEPSPFKLLPSGQPFYASRILGDERSPISIRPQREFEASHEAIDDDQHSMAVVGNLPESMPYEGQILEKLDRIIDLLESHNA